MNDLMKKYKALGQKCRFRIMYLLLEVKESLCICELMDVLDQPQYQVSRCLTILKEAGLVNEEREGRILMHSLNYSDPLNKTLFSSIRSIDIEKNGLLLDDIDKLKKRLSTREEMGLVAACRQ